MYYFLLISIPILNGLHHDYRLVSTACKLIENCFTEIRGADHAEAIIAVAIVPRTFLEFNQFPPIIVAVRKLNKKIRVHKSKWQSKQRGDNKKNQ